MYSLSVRVRQCRSAARFSQAQLAALVGVHRSAVAQWEQADGTSPSVDHLAQVATASGVLFEWLATGRGSMFPAGCEFEVATQVGDFARDELENRILDSMRRLSRRHREMACRIVEQMSR